MIYQEKVQLDQLVLINNFQEWTDKYWSQFQWIFQGQELHKYS